MSQKCLSTHGESFFKDTSNGTCTSDNSARSDHTDHELWCICRVTIKGCSHDTIATAIYLLQVMGCM